MYVFFFFQAEDGIRDLTVTGVQTCALPISSGDRRGPGPGHRGGAGVRGCVAVAAADPAAGPRRWQGGHGAAAAHVGGVHRPLSAGAAARLGDRGGRAVRHLGLRPGGRPGARNANAGEGDVMRQVWLAMLLVAGATTAKNTPGNPPHTQNSIPLPAAE